MTRIPDTKRRETADVRNRNNEKPVKTKSALENFMAKIMKSNDVKGDEY